ncbi:MAG: hypothetical protein WCG25_01790 [bacterium]
MRAYVSHFTLNLFVHHITLFAGSDNIFHIKYTIPGLITCSRYCTTF